MPRLTGKLLLGGRELAGEAKVLSKRASVLRRFTRDSPFVFGTAASRQPDGYTVVSR